MSFLNTDLPSCICASLLKSQNVTLHAKRGLIQISRHGYFHGPSREIVKKLLEFE